MSRFDLNRLSVYSISVSEGIGLVGLNEHAALCGVADVEAERLSEVAELEERVASAIGVRDEEGSNSGSDAVDCGVAVVYCVNLVAVERNVALRAVRMSIRSVRIDVCAIFSSPYDVKLSVRAVQQSGDTLPLESRIMYALSSFLTPSTVMVLTFSFAIPVSPISTRSITISGMVKYFVRMTLSGYFIA